jgi:uridine kinase
MPVVHLAVIQVILLLAHLAREAIVAMCLYKVQNVLKVQNYQVMNTQHLLIVEGLLWPNQHNGEKAMLLSSSA